MEAIPYECRAFAPSQVDDRKYSGTSTVRVRISHAVKPGTARMRRAVQRPNPGKLHDLQTSIKIALKWRFKVEH